MTMYAWKDGFRTGIDHIDAQHKQFFYLLNELDMAIEQRREDDILGLMISELERYARIHFDTEEKLLEGIGYPDLPRQRSEHEYFAGQVREFRERHRKGDERLGASALEFMREWFINHIITEDHKFGEFLFAGRSPLP